MNRLEQIANWITGHVGLVAWIVAVLIALLAADTVACVVVTTAGGGNDGGLATVEVAADHVTQAPGGVDRGGMAAMTGPLDGPCGRNGLVGHDGTPGMVAADTGWAADGAADSKR